MTEELAVLSCQQFEFITKSNIKINGLSNINESLSVHYLIYRIDNLENGKHYIGQHFTQNPLDDYMGSGKLILKSIAKHGIEKFVKTILFDFNNFEKMNEKEKELVPLSACYPYDKMSYNLKEGGHNGRLTEQSIQKLSEVVKMNWTKKSQEELELHGQKCKHVGKENGMYGRKRTADETSRMSATRIAKGSSKGSNNGMFGRRGKSSPNYGSKRTLEQRLRMSIAAKNRGKSEKRSKALSEQRQGTKHMYNPITYESGFKKNHEVQAYIQLGWKLGKDPYIES